MLWFAMLFAFLRAAFLVSIVAALSAMIFAAILVVFSAFMFCTALFAAFFATATRPGNGLHFHHGPQWIVAVNHDFGWMRLSLRRFVTYHHVQARPGVQRGRKRIVHQVPMPVLVLERHLGYVQLTLAHIAHRYRPECPRPHFTPPK